MILTINVGVLLLLSSGNKRVPHRLPIPKKSAADLAVAIPSFEPGAFLHNLPWVKPNASGPEDASEKYGSINALGALGFPFFLANLPCRTHYRLNGSDR